MRILGVDPGLRHMGWGVIDTDGPRLRHVANGVCHSAGNNLPERLLSLFEQLNSVITTYVPDLSAIEQTFVNKDGSWNFEIRAGAGRCRLALAKAGLNIGEYAPNAVKKNCCRCGSMQTKSRSPIWSVCSCRVCSLKDLMPQTPWLLLFAIIIRLEGR